MKPRCSNQRDHALTLVEVLAVSVIVAVLVCFLLPALASARKKSQRIHCVNNLMQIGLSFRIWEGDHTNLYPMSISTNLGGTLEYVASGETFRHFQVMSNELSTPYILICPADMRPRAKDFGPTLSNTNVSYFVGVDVDETKPGMLLSGDRNIVGGTKLANEILEITTNQLIGWSSEMHNSVGDIGLVDGSVVALGRGGFADWPEWGVKPAATNRLAIP
jgi:prepilin-type N-terminal cleavage/methylation domain-containing protein